jgi:hypothetical protein
MARAGLSRLKEIEPPEPVRRYERDKLGDKFHIDIKKLARFERIGRRITSDRTGRSNSRDIERFIQTALRNRPTLSDMRHSGVEPLNCQSGCIITIGNAHTAASNPTTNQSTRADPGCRVRGWRIKAAMPPSTSSTSPAVTGALHLIIRPSQGLRISEVCADLDGASDKAT